MGPLLAARFETGWDTGRSKGRLTAVPERRVASSVVLVYAPALDEVLRLVADAAGRTGWPEPWMTPAVCVAIRPAISSVAFPENVSARTAA